MLFAIWYAWWVIVAESSAKLVFPGVVLAVRSSYLNRTFLKLSYLVLATVIFLWLSSLPEVAWQVALFRALQALAFLSLTGHLIVGASQIKMRWLPAEIVWGKHLIARYLRIVNERVDDVRYACRARKGYAYRFGIWKPRTIIAFGTSLISECLVLVNHLSMIITSRGDIIHPSNWQKEREGKARHFIGDIALLVLIIFLYLMGPENAIPKQVSDYLDPARHRIERIIYNAQPEAVTQNPENGT